MKVKIEDNNEKSFDDKVIVLRGNFRQILPFVRKRSKNMRLNVVKTNESAWDIKKFANWVFEIWD